MATIFLSYAHEDLSAARKVYAALSATPGIEVWFDKESLKPGEIWSREIRSAIANADSFLLLLSRCSTAKRGFIQREVREALNVLAELPEGEVFVIPARLDDCEPHFEELARLHYVDLFPDFAGGLARIVHSVTSRAARTADQTTASTPLVRFTSHVARFVRGVQDCYFVNVTNLGPANGSRSMIAVEARGWRGATKAHTAGMY